MVNKSHLTRSPAPGTEQERNEALISILFMGRGFRVSHLLTSRVKGGMCWRHGRQQPGILPIRTEYRMPTVDQTGVTRDVSIGDGQRADEDANKGEGLNATCDG